MKTANDTTLVFKVAPLLLFKDRLTGSDGEHFIRHDANVHSRQYLVNNDLTQLTQPRPDICIDYVCRYEADGRTMAKFTAEEETVLCGTTQAQETKHCFLSSLDRPNQQEATMEKAVL